MYLRLSVALFLVLSCFGIKAQALKLDCSGYAGGVFIKGNDADSVLVYRGMEYWIEADLKAHECRVYKIAWINACNFTLIFNNRIDENKGYYLRKELADSLFLNATSSDSTEITYTVKTPKQADGTNSLTLKPLHDSLAWEYLVYIDSSLYFDTTEIRKLYGIPLQNYYFNTPSFIALETNPYDAAFVSYVLGLFEQGDIKPAFNFASILLKTNSPQSILEDYNQYIAHMFGKLKSYEVSNLHEGYRVAKKIYSHAYVIKAHFEKLQTGASICISTAPGGNTPLLALSVAIDSVKATPFLNELTHPFWEMLKHKKYRKIYDSSSSALKNNITLKAAVKILDHIDSLGHLDNYELSSQNYTVMNNKGMLDVSYKCILPEKTLLLNLFYTFEDGEYKLVAFNAPKN